MSVFRSDIGNDVQAPGDYPFRDGPLPVTAAEIAVWKQSPDAVFQLMKKHPVDGRVAYVLGPRVEPGTSSPHLIYQSSNSDSWYLTQDTVTGARVVMHQPNLSSGGRSSLIDVDKFLLESPEGPQHQALRELVGRTAG